MELSKRAMRFFCRQCLFFIDGSADSDASQSNQMEKMLEYVFDQKLKGVYEVVHGLQTQVNQIKLLMETIRAKESIIEDKTRIIEHLEERIVKQTLSQRQDGNKNKNKGNRATNGSVLGAPNVTDTFSRTARSGTSGSINQPDNLKSMRDHQSSVMNKLINLADNESGPAGSYTHHIKQAPQIDDVAGATWKTVTHRRRKNKTTLGANTSELSIAAVESRRSIFVSRLSPDTTSEKLRQYLVGVNIRPLSVEKLDIRSKEIAAFKVVVQQSDEKRATACELWPKYTIIRPFRQPRSFLQGVSQSDQTN